MSAVLELTGVSKRYPGDPPVDSLRDVGLRIEEGELVAIVGPSGSGKTTLLHIVGTLERPTAGEVRVAGDAIGGLSDSQLSGLRAHNLGFVFQQFFLLDGISVLDNVACGLLYRGTEARERRRLAVEALERVGLGSRMGHRPAQLSGGERQRAPLPRAVLGRPAPRRGRSPPAPPLCSPTSRPATSTRPPGRRSSPSSKSSTATAPRSL